MYWAFKVRDGQNGLKKMDKILSWSQKGLEKVTEHIKLPKIVPQYNIAENKNATGPQNAGSGSLQYSKVIEATVAPLLCLQSNHIKWHTENSQD